MTHFEIWIERADRPERPVGCRAETLEQAQADVLDVFPGWRLSARVPRREVGRWLDDPQRSRA